MEKECASRRVENEEIEIQMKVSDKEKIALVDDIEEALANSRDLKKNVDTLTKEQFEANKQQDYLKIKIMISKITLLCLKMVLNLVI